MNRDYVYDRFEKDLRTTKSGLSNQYKEAEECMAFYAGDHMRYRDYFNFNTGRPSGKMKEVQFNRVKPYVNSVVGFFAQIRGKAQYNAVNPNQEEQRMYSEYLNSASDYVRDNANSAQIETMQDKDLLVCGYGATDTCATISEGEATRDPNGEILQERIHPLQVGWDPEATDPNLLDSKWAYRVKEYYVEEAEMLFNAEEQDFELSEAESGPYSFLPGGGIQDKIAYEYADFQRRMVRVYFYQWYEVEDFYRIENPVYRALTQEAQEALLNAFLIIENNVEDELFKFDPRSELLVITKDNKSEIKKIFDEFEIPFKPFKQKRKVYYTAIISGKRVFDFFKSPSQQGFSIKFKTGDRDEVKKIWTGMVSSMKDPVRYYNKSLTQLMIIIAYNSKGGVLIEEGATDNIQDFERRYSLTDAVIQVNEGAISGGKIKDKIVPKVPNGYEDILAISDRAISQVTGLDETFFGVSGGGNETAMLQRQRIKQASTILAVYLDNIMLYQKEQARLMLSFIRLLADTSKGKIFTVYDDNGNMIVEKLSPDFLVDEYHIKISDAPETPVQKEYYTELLMSVAQTMQAVGNPKASDVLAAAVKYMPLPERDKMDVIEAVKSESVDPRVVQQLQQQIQQLMSQQQQIRMAKDMADVEKTKADAQKAIVDARLKEKDIQHKDAEIGKVLEETEKQAIENDLMTIKPIDQVNITL